MAIPTYIGSRFDQICFVVEDLDAATDYWKRVHGVERWAIAYDLASGQHSKQYWGEPEDFQFSCAYGFAGDVLIELARHDGGRSVYADWLRDKGSSPHHIGFRVRTMDEYEDGLAHYNANGHATAMTGWFEAPDGGGCRWAYLDTVAAIGCYTELYVLAGQAERQFDLFKQGLADSLIPS
jgi:catechol 2,3-dioxygenase-like lactoylglutathione lyase family enzyme